MRHESSTSARRVSELEQAEQKAEYVRLLAEEALERAEAAYWRAVASFLKADERYLEALAAASFEGTPSGIVETLARRMRERARAVKAVERKCGELEEAAQFRKRLPRTQAG